MISIAQHLDPEDIFAEIRMERQAHRGAFLLLEGITDIRRFSKFLVEDCSTVNCWGKPKLLRVLELVDHYDFAGALALADADFDRFTNDLQHSANLIYSETHDFDLDCIRSGAFFAYLEEAGDHEKIAALGGAQAVLEFVLEALHPISCARLCNRRGVITCSLSDLEWDPCYSPFKVNRGMYAAKALKKTGLTREAVEAMLSVMAAEEEENHDLWQITNGHDFCVALGISLREALGSRGKQQTTGQEVEMHLRLVYQFHHFDTGAVAAAIREWEAQSETFRILQ
ncbi:hypothetical protein [Pelagibacterium sp.]|uniref:hypothetical protein n=1 Tax=Pelagibacterium sp. TaxID=1967288 RepID=UPI003A92C97B